MAGVDYVRTDLSERLPDYKQIDDCCEGQRRIKACGETYLPIPNKENTAEAVSVAARYNAYVKRAIFTNFTGRTLEGFLGLIFNKDPIVTVPARTGIVVKNADGSGVTLTQLTKTTTSLVIRKGRAGLLVDYPMTDRPATLAEANAGDVRPVILAYDPADVVNWDSGSKGSKVYLTLVVLKEIYTERLPGDFEVKKKDQYRVLELVDPLTNLRVDGKIPANAIYRQSIYRRSEGSTGFTQFGIGATSTGETVSFAYPKDGKGKSLTEIPFTFIGSDSNNSNIDKPPLLDISNLNLGHYRNSADYEDSVFLLGQPTPWASELTKDWVKDVLGGKIQLGSRSTIPLPKGGTIGLLQAEPNTMAFEAMKDKEKQMVSIGAKLIEDAGKVKTATEASSDNVSENSVLGSIAGNVETAIRYCLEWCAIFTGEIDQDADARDKSIKFELNKKFDVQFMSSADRAQLLLELQAGVISFSEYRNNLKKSGIFLDENATAETEIAKYRQQALDDEVAKAKAMAEAVPPKEPVANAA